MWCWMDFNHAKQLSQSLRAPRCAKSLWFNPSMCSNLIEAPLLPLSAARRPLFLYHQLQPCLKFAGSLFGPKNTSFFFFKWKRRPFSALFTAQKKAEKLQSDRWWYHWKAHCKQSLILLSKVTEKCSHHLYSGDSGTLNSKLWAFSS